MNWPKSIWAFRYPDTPVTRGWWAVRGKTVPAGIQAEYLLAEWARREYRVVWKRKGEKQKTRKYVRLDGAERFRALLEGRVWEYLQKRPDDYACCPGRECGCGGQTYRSISAETMSRLAPTEFIRIESRSVGDWEQ